MRTRPRLRRVFEPYSYSAVHMIKRRSTLGVRYHFKLYDCGNKGVSNSMNAFFGLSSQAYVGSAAEFEGGGACCGVL